MSNSEPKISVVICTYNRARYLPGCLESLLAQTLDACLFEVIIVNNNSTDMTRQIAEDYAAKHASIRIVDEFKQGLSHARNRGWREARAQFVAFLDDDSTASPVWLEKIVWVFENIQPLPACVGGEIDLTWEAPRPRWLGDDMLPPLGRLAISSIPCDLTSGYLFGGNIALPKFILEELGGFDPGLGRGASDMMGNEEIMLQDLLRQKNQSIYYHPEALIYHVAHKNRLCKSWFLRRMFWQGVSEAKLQGPEVIFIKISRLAWITKQIVSHATGLIWERDMAVRMRMLLAISAYWGYMCRQLKIV